MFYTCKAVQKKNYNKLMKYFYFCKGQDRRQIHRVNSYCFVRMHHNSSQATVQSMYAHTVSAGFRIELLKDASITLVRLLQSMLQELIPNIYIGSSCCCKPHIKKCFIKMNQASEECTKGQQPNLDFRIFFICFIGKFFCMSSVI